MAEITLSNKDWQRVKIKIQRKYNHLTDEQLQYTEGQEESLITNLMHLVNRNREYVVFTLKKALVRKCKMMEDLAHQPCNPANFLVQQLQKA